LSLAAALASLLAAPALAWDGQAASIPSPPLGVRQAEYPIHSLLPPANSPLQQCSLLTQVETACQPGDSCVSCDPGCGYGSPLEIGGWISAGIYANAHGAPRNGPLGFNDLGDGFNVHQMWVYAEKPVNTGGCGWDWGYRADFMFGVDGPDTQAFGGLGWDTTWDTSANYGFAMPQLYAEVGIDDWTIKAGHFYTTHGAEVVPALNNFFYSHSYSFYYGEPFTHTGVLASYAWSDDVTFFGGWTQGWDTGFDNTPQADTFLGGVSFPLTDRIDFAYTVSAGDFGPATAGKAALGLPDGGIYLHSFLFTWAINDRWTYVFHNDFAVNSPAGVPSNRWNGIVQYLQYKINECWATGVRIEVFDDPQGARVSYNGPATGTYGELTWGLNWTPRERLVVRPELRYDWFNGLSAANQQPFDNGNASDQFSGGFDVIWTF
jgi:hypothetical protein